MRLRARRAGSAAIGPDRLVLVTGAGKSDARSLYQLLASVRRHEPDLTVVAYDMGLKWRQRWKARRVFPCTLRTVTYRHYPPHLDLKAGDGQHAWKPVIINEVAASHGGIVCWMEADSLLTGDLAALRAFVREHGFYSPGSGGTIGDSTHPGMLSRLGLPEDWDRRASQNLNGACVAFDTGDSDAMAVIAEWGRLAWIRECISPPASDRRNRRPDQALLTVLAYRSGLVSAPADNILGFRLHAEGA